VAVIEESILIRCPVDQVFAYVTNVTNFTRWVADMVDVELISPGPMEIGTTFKGANQIMGQRMPWTSQVTQYELNKRWGAVSTSGSTFIEETIFFDSVEGGTKFTVKYNIKLGGFLKLVSPIMANSMHSQTRNNLTTLKKLLEA
jgi:uncharacterized membrane protein